MNMRPDEVALKASTAMILEASATPKPGNVDREHEFRDMGYLHFMKSAVVCKPIFENACGKTKGVGKFIRRCVEACDRAHGKNTSFGTFLLLIPLVMGCGFCSTRTELRKAAMNILRSTDFTDSIELYLAFRVAKVRVRKVRELDVYDDRSVEEIRRRRLSFQDLMKLSSSRDMVARELCSGYRLAFRFCRELSKLVPSVGLNDAIVWSYVKLLSSTPDTFVETKFGREKALDVMRRASELRTMDDVRRFDEELIEEGVNPGSSADIIAASIFLWLL